MRFVLKSALFILFILLISTISYSQNLTGIWRGYFITDGGDQYKYELQINHNKKNRIIGVSYSYLDTRFYGKAELAGSYTKMVSSALVNETKTVEVKMSGGSVACIMKCLLSYSKSGKEEFLEGNYSSSYETTNQYYGVKRGADCGGGKVYLRKVPTSEFYTEPFLKKAEGKKSTPKPTPAITKKPPVTKKQTTTTKKTTQTTTKKPVQTTPKKEEPIVKKQKVEVIETIPRDQVVIENKPINKKISTTPITTRDRKNELTRTIQIKNKEIEIRLYDNGEIDDDTVSVYLNGKIILANKRLSDKPISYKINMSENEEFVLIMVAENMGRIPPNTSLLIVQDGDQRYQVSITSTEQKNAMVLFKYQKQE